MSSPRQYRGLRDANGKWVHGWHVEWNGHSYIEFSRPDCSWYDNIRVEVIPETVGQETGLKDMSGVDLDWWEGDLISSAKSRVIHEIFWHEKDGQWCGRRVNFITDPPDYKPLCEYAQIEGFEVIGNIHQHPHLLEGANV